MDSDDNLSNLESDQEDDFEFDVNDQKVWLVKVPQFLHDNWLQQPTNQTLGEMTINSPSSISLKLSDTSLPTDYNVKITNFKPESMFTFTSNSAGNAVGIVGKIEHEAVLNPVIDDNYLELIRKRNQKEEVVDRTVKVLDRKQAKKGAAQATMAQRWDTHTTKKIVLDKITEERID